MATKLIKTLGGAPPVEAPDENPWDALIAAQIERMGQRTRAPTLTPEQVAQRRSQNEEEYELGLLGSMSKHDNLRQVGGQILRNAIAARTPRITERGTADPISGEFSYDPDYLDQQDQVKLEAMQKLKIAADLKRDADEKERSFRREQAEFNAGVRRDIAGLAGGGGGLGAGTAQQIGSGPAQEPIFRDKAGRLFTYDENGSPIAYKGKVGVKASSGQPSEDERKAAGWAAQAELGMMNAFKAMAEDPEAAKPTLTERAVSFVPGIGDDLANMARSPSRQKFMQAASSFAEAALRAATGAGVNKDEALQKINELTPRYGESREVQAQKLASWRMYLKSLQMRAGRALPQGPGAPAGDDPDPLGMNGGR